MRRGAVILVLVAVLAGACGDSDGDSVADAPDSVAAATTTPASTTAEPSPGATTETTDMQSGGPETTALPTTIPAETTAPVTPPTMVVTDVADGGEVPQRYTCDGANDVPTVTIGGVDPGVTELVLVVDDPDAPTDTPFVHWIVLAIPPTVTDITDGLADVAYGTNDVGLTEWFGPCPPRGDDPHTYRWRLFALSGTPEVAAGADGRAVEAALEGLVVVAVEVTATYGRAA